MKFSTRLVIELVSIVLVVAGVIWGMDAKREKDSSDQRALAASDVAGLRSDVRDILTRLDSKQKLDDDRNAALNGKIAEVRMQLTKSEGAIEELRKQLADLREKFIAGTTPRSRP